MLMVNSPAKPWKCQLSLTFQTESRGLQFDQYEIHRTVSFQIQGARSVKKTLHMPWQKTMWQQPTICSTVRQRQTSLMSINNGLQTSREERLAKAEAPSEASLLLASRKERLPGGRRCRGGREERPRPPQSTTRPSEEQWQGGGQEEAGGSSAARRQRTQRKTEGGRLGG